MKREDKAPAAALLRGMLAVSKDVTIRSIYERLTPGEDGCIRSVMSPAGTETGRFSHSETFLEASTNLANLPNKTATGDALYRVREVIVPHVGRTMWKADYSQAEARWCAYMAEDKRAIREYAEGVDRYRAYVRAFHNDDAYEVPKLERQVIGKVGILSCQYGVQWRTVMDTINKDADLTGITCDAKSAKRMVELFADLYPETVRWWHAVEDEVLTKGYLVNPFGRKRIFFARRDSESARSALVREAIAYGPQSANADMLSIALIRLYEKHDPRDLHLLLQVHDELVGDCAPQDWSQVARIVRETMEFSVEVSGRELRIPAEVSVTSTDWSHTRAVA